MECKTTEGQEYAASPQGCTCKAADGFTTLVANPLTCQCDANMGYKVDKTGNAWKCSCQTEATKNFVAKDHDGSGK